MFTASAGRSTASGGLYGASAGSGSAQGGWSTASGAFPTASGVFATASGALSVAFGHRYNASAGFSRRSGVLGAGFLDPSTASGNWYSANGAGDTERDPQLTNGFRKRAAGRAFPEAGSRWWPQALGARGRPAELVSARRLCSSRILNEPGRLNADIVLRLNGITSSVHDQDRPGLRTGREPWLVNPSPFFGS
jgi:hypothetical protein